MEKLKLNRYRSNLPSHPFAYKLDGFVILYVSAKFWILSKGYKLYRYDVDSCELSQFCSVPDTKNRILSVNRFTRRLFRAEIRNVYSLQNGNWLLICRKALYIYDTSTNKVYLSKVISNGSRPMSVCVANNGHLYFGDYFFNPQNNPMNIYRSKDNGESWDVCYTFPKGAINHIHGIFQDRYSDKLWVATGDLDKECIFGYTDDDFLTFIPIMQGRQEARICYPLFYKYGIVYSTDSQYAQNSINRISNDDWSIEKLRDIQGSGIYAMRTNDFALVSTTVEPSETNKDTYSHLWYSKNGIEWNEIDKYKKDMLNPVYFQFGSIRFPDYSNENGLPIVYFGRAVKGLDQSSIILSDKEL